MSVLETKRFKVLLTFQEEVLGTLPQDPEIFKDYVAPQNPDRTPDQVEREALTIPTETEIGEDEEIRPLTVFPRTIVNGVRVPGIYGYVLKGQFKNACAALRNHEGTVSSTISAFRKNIANLIHVNEAVGCDPISPMLIDQDLINPDGTLPRCQRPLRASTPQGERIAVSASEQVPAGTQVEFTIDVFGGEIYEAALQEWLDYGQYNGLGCWRGSGKGRFTWELLEGEFPDYEKVRAKALKKKTKKTAATEE